MEQITLSFDESLLAAARQCAAAERTTLDAKCHEWLAAYAQRRQATMETGRQTRGELAVATARELHRQRPTSGRKFTRE